MDGFIALRNELRGVVHENLSSTCSYKQTAQSDAVSVSVRLHTDVEIVSRGENGYAELIDVVNRAVFNASEVSPAIGSSFVVNGGGSFVVSKIFPVDGPFEIVCQVVNA